MPQNFMKETKTLNLTRRTFWPLVWPIFWLNNLWNVKNFVPSTGIWYSWGGFPHSGSLPITLKCIDISWSIFDGCHLEGHGCNLQPQLKTCYNIWLMESAPSASCCSHNSIHLWLCIQYRATHICLRRWGLIRIGGVGGKSPPPGCPKICNICRPDMLHQQQQQHPTCLMHQNAFEIG